jgi:hypothetical protein
MRCTQLLQRSNQQTLLELLLEQFVELRELGSLQLLRQLAEEET